MALKILVILVVSTLSSALPDPGVNINVNINVAEDAGNEKGPDDHHSFFFCGVDFNPPGTKDLTFERKQIQLLIKLGELSVLTDYCNETIPFTNLSAEDIEFRLYDSSTTNYRRLITNKPASVDSSSLNSSLPLLVVVHGWTEDADNATWMHQIKDQWLEKIPINVMLVQWKNLAANIIYPQAVNNAKFVGTELAALLKFLKSYTGLSPSNTHIVGVSLGAQVAGAAGQQLDDLSRITGLDPAGPLLQGAPLSERLDASDADFVDVIHTNAGGLGFAKPCGHVDFYMNGGTFQIGCLISDPNSKLAMFDTCSHALAPFYYIESLATREHSYGFLCENQTAFQAGLCLNNANNTMGYGVKPDPAGVFYSATQVLCQKLSTSLFPWLTCK